MNDLPVPSNLAGQPAPDTQVPPLVREAVTEHGYGAHDLCFRPVWYNGEGGLTFAIEPKPNEAGLAREPVLYAKWNPAGSLESLADEAERLGFVAGHHPAPGVVAYAEQDREEVLVTRALAGSSAVSERWVSSPEQALIALGKGLRQLHEMPLDGCPYDWGVDYRLRVAGVDPATVGPVPDIDRLVMCHGDACAPNTLIDDAGNFLAHVDLGRVGVADRWADLAVLTMSLAWNYRDYDESIFWRAYGAQPDWTRIDFYRRLWDAT